MTIEAFGVQYLGLNFFNLKADDSCGYTPRYYSIDVWALRFKAIPLTQTLVVFIYTAMFSFIINDFIKFTILKKWPLEPVERKESKETSQSFR